MCVNILLSSIRYSALSLLSHGDSRLTEFLTVSCLGINEVRFHRLGFLLFFSLLKSLKLSLGPDFVIPATWETGGRIGSSRTGWTTYPDLVSK